MPPQPRPVETLLEGPFADPGSADWTTGGDIGLDGARVILGHRSPAITDLYAELDREKALDIMAKHG